MVASSSKGMSSSSSTNNLVQKSSNFAAVLNKLTKQTNDYSEMNSVNSNILLNPTSIKTNYPVINSLYQPILSQTQDAIGLSSLRLTSFPSNLNPYLLASSFQSIQNNNKNNFHPYFRNQSLASTLPNQNNNSSIIQNNNSRNGHQFNQQISCQTNKMSGNFNSNSPISSFSYTNLLNNNNSKNFNPSNNNANSVNFRLSDDVNYFEKYASNLQQGLINQSSNQSSFLPIPSLDNHRLLNDYNQKNWLLNNQFKSHLNNQFHSISSLNGSNKKISLTTKKRRVSNKNISYLEPTDSVKKLDRIISNHNKNLKEIIKHKNQLIKTISKQQQLPRNIDTIIQTFDNGQTNNSYERSQKKSNNNNFPISASSSNQSNSNTVICLTNAEKLVSNKSIWRPQSFPESPTNELLISSNNSLDLITKAMIEEAELKKQTIKKNKKCRENKPEDEKNNIKENLKNEKLLKLNRETSLVNNENYLSTNEDTCQTDQNNINKQVVNEKPKKLISKLDEREFRLKARRKALKEKDYNDSLINNEDSQVFYHLGEEDEELMEDDLEKEISDVEYEDEYAYRLRYHSILMKTSRLPFTHDKVKENFLSNLGLTSNENKINLDFEKLLRSKKDLKEIGENKNDENLNLIMKAQNIKSLKSEKVHIESSELMPSKLNNFDSDDIKNKLKYMNVLGLMLETNNEKIKKKELFWEGVLQDRERRKDFDLCFEKLLDNLNPKVKDEWLNSLDNEIEFDNHSTFSKLNDKTNAINSVSNGIKVNINLTSTDRIPSKDGLLTTVPQLQASQLLIDQNEKLNAQSKVISNTNNDQLCISKITSFTNSNMQITSNLKSIDEIVENLSNRNKNKDNTSNVFKWPGIEAIQKAYYHYNLEQELEKKQLMEKLKKMNALLTKKTKESESVNLKLSVFIQAKKDLIEDQEKLKLLLDNLKWNLSQF